MAIVGGGFSGAALAALLLRSGCGQLRITLLESGTRLARGVAYGTADPVPRTPFCARSGTEVVDVAPIGSGGFAVVLEGGIALHADEVVLATGHPPPPDPLARWLPLGEPRYIRDPSRTNALAAIAPGERVLLLGTGLAMIDVVLTLAARGLAGSLGALRGRSPEVRATLRVQAGRIRRAAVTSQGVDVSLEHAPRRLDGAVRADRELHGAVVQQRKPAGPSNGACSSADFGSSLLSELGFVTTQSEQHSAVPEVREQASTLATALLARHQATPSSLRQR